MAIRLNDRMMDLDRPISISVGSKEVFSGLVSRTIATISATLAEYGDPSAVFAAELECAPLARWRLDRQGSSHNNAWRRRRS